MGRLTILLLLCSCTLCGQTIEEGPEAAFAFRVKQIDEFIDRFNHAPHTPALRLDPGLTHRENMYSLFNQEEKNWNLELIESFVDEMLAAPDGNILDFYDAGWYAELRCSFLYRGVPRDFTLILENQLTSNGGSKWVIASVLEGMREISCHDIPKAESDAHYLHPMSHATNFMDLDRALNDKENLHNLFDPWNQTMDFLAFKNAVRNGALQYRFHRRITYHFLQLENWIFTVDYFSRRDRNAGWLISSLRRASAKEKERYQAEKLNLS